MTLETLRTNGTNKTVRATHRGTGRTFRIVAPVTTGKKAILRVAWSAFNASR